MPDVTIPGPADGLRGHLAVPPGDGPWPGVVVLHEVYGLTDDIRDHAERLATEGYLALAPDLFSWSWTPRCLVSTFRTLFSGAGRTFEDIEAARATLAEDQRCTGQVGVIGFCMGGGFALLAAPRMAFGVAAVNYGRVPDDVEQVLPGTCPVVASYGGRDPTYGRHGYRLQAALSRLGVEHDVKTYPDASHSFLNRHSGLPAVLGRATGTGFHGPSAEDAWQRILAFFDRHLRAE